MLAKLLGMKLAELRWAKHSTVQQASAAVGMTASTLDSIETGNIDIDLVTLNDVCCQYGITLADLLGSLKSERNLTDEWVECSIPKPHTLDEYRKSRNFYELRLARTLWNLKKISLSRKRRIEMIDGLRTRRGQLAENRADRPPVSKTSDSTL